MTSVEDKVRAALRGKADQVPSSAVPPLRLPARRRRPFSLAYGGGRRNRAGLARLVHGGSLRRCGHCRGRGVGDRISCPVPAAGAEGPADRGSGGEH